MAANPLLPVTYLNRLAAHNGLDKILIVSPAAFSQNTHAQAFVADLVTKGALTASASLSTASQAEMEAGTETALRSMSPARVKQAILALAPAQDLSGYALTTEVTAAITAAIAALTNGAPTALNQLNELSAALGNDANFSTTVLNGLAKRLRVDASQSFTSGEKIQGRSNLGLGTMALEVATDFYKTTEVFSRTQTLRAWAVKDKQLTPQTPGVDAPPATNPKLIVTSDIFSARSDGDYFTFRLMESGDDVAMVLIEIDSAEDGSGGEGAVPMTPPDWTEPSNLASYFADKLSGLGVTATNVGDGTVSLVGPNAGSIYGVRIVTSWSEEFSAAGSDAGEPTPAVDGVVQVVLQAPTKSGGCVVPTQISVRKNGAPSAGTIDFGFWDGSSFTLLGRLDVNWLADFESVSIVDPRWDWSLNPNQENMVTGMADCSLVARVQDLAQFDSPGNTFTIAAHGLEI